MYTGLQVLRAKVRGLEAAGKTLRHRIQKASGSKRHKLWLEKRTLGGYNRDHLVAYGLLRNISYGSIERCAKLNKPNAERIFELMKTHGDWKIKRELTLDQVKLLLNTDGLPLVIKPVRPPSKPWTNRLLVKVRGLLEKGETK